MMLSSFITEDETWIDNTSATVAISKELNFECLLHLPYLILQERKDWEEKRKEKKKKRQRIWNGVILYHQTSKSFKRDYMQGSYSMLTFFSVQNAVILKPLRETIICTSYSNLLKN
ncbi:hypothetical protein CDAR_66581 [Caerostris darwini]|uniref:Uncharacterized protein n=1 Tax=Caerostris darwini TaxID=1538125 RepID=A0AAV4X0E7_9ARAC|nr:hypothetical protein CDAR_66581 [Caerostris darwini]